jgi:hypothetical protein
MTGGGVETYKDKFNTKYGFPKGTSHTVAEIAKLTGFKKAGLDVILEKGKGAFYSNPESVRPHVKSADQWAMSRLYASVSPGSKSSRVDAKQLKKGRAGPPAVPPPPPLVPIEPEEVPIEEEGEDLLPSDEWAEIIEREGASFIQQVDPELWNDVQQFGNEAVLLDMNEEHLIQLPPDFTNRIVQILENEVPYIEDQGWQTEVAGTLERMVEFLVRFNL